MSSELFYDVMTVLFNSDNFLPLFNCKTETKDVIIKSEGEIYELTKDIKTYFSDLQFDDVIELSSSNSFLRNKLKSFYNIRLSQRFPFINRIKKDKRFKTPIRMFEQFQYCKLPDFIINLIDLKNDYEDDDKVLFIPVVPYLHDASTVEIRKTSDKHYEIYPNIQFCTKKESLTYNFSKFKQFVKSTRIFDEDENPPPKKFFDYYFEIDNEKFKELMKFIRKSKYSSYEQIKKRLISYGFYPLSYSKFQDEMEKRFHLKELDPPSCLRCYVPLFKKYMMDEFTNDKRIETYHNRFKSIRKFYGYQPHYQDCKKILKRSYNFYEIISEYLEDGTLPEDKIILEFISNISKYGNKEDSLIEFMEFDYLKLDFTFCKHNSEEEY